MNDINKKRLRISQLAKLAGVSTATIKHYVNEGLIDKPVKTGKTMAYYDEPSVARIKQIKKLQKEKFLPLEVIKRVVNSKNGIEEEAALGKAMLKSEKTTDGRPVPESKIEKRTGYPLKKIKILESEGLIFPDDTKDGRFFDSIDIKIIEVFKVREEIGLPFDHNLSTIRAYRDAINKAVTADIKNFSKSILGDISTKKAITLITKGDEALETFMINYRQKMNARVARKALSSLDDLEDNLNDLVFFPIDGKDMPKDPADDFELEALRLLLTDDLKGLVSLCRAGKGDDKQVAVWAQIFGLSMLGKTDEAMKIVEKEIPKPTARPFENSAAAIACIFSIPTAPGFSGPISFAKRCLGYLKRIEATPYGAEAGKVFSRYICGAIYIMLPDIFDVRDAGISMLKEIAQDLRSGNVIKGDFPDWFLKTLDYEVLPALEIKVNKFLATGCMLENEKDTTKAALARMIEIADPDSEDAKWARLTKKILTK
jgi:DNA-binding transcriptional MerR regulator